MRTSNSGVYVLEHDAQGGGYIMTDIPPMKDFKLLGHRKWQDYTMEKTRPKVAMVGFADGITQVPWKDESMEIWTCNDLPQHLNTKRFDRSFQFHSDHDRMRVAWPDWQQHLYWLYAQHDYPIYMQHKYANVPSSVRFPKKEIEAMVPHGWYFAHSFCWMVAFAILLEFEEIHLYGCGGSSGEPLSAMACMHYWMGVAEGRGIKVEIHGEGELFVIDQIVRSRKQYGYDLTRLVLKHEGLDPLSGVIPPTEGTDYPELDELQLYGEAKGKGWSVGRGDTYDDPAGEVANFELSDDNGS